jgi:hypothetical protein
MSGDGEEKVPCETCGVPTPMTGTKRCDSCWEVENRLGPYIAAGGDDAARFVVAALGGRGKFVADREFGVGVPGLIAEECYALRDLLISKNRKYNNSALDPVRIFSKASPHEQILVRLDDKISRLRSGQLDDDEDVIQDLLGYLILLRIARRLNAAQVAAQLDESLAGPAGKP